MKLNLLCYSPGHNRVKPVALILSGAAALAALSCVMQIAVPLTLIYLVDHLDRARSLF